MWLLLVVAGTALFIVVGRLPVNSSASAPIKAEFVPASPAAPHQPGWAMPTAAHAPLPSEDRRADILSVGSDALQVRESVLRRIQSEQDPTIQDALIQGFIGNLAVEEIRDVLDLLTNHPAKEWQELHRDLRMRLIRKWAGLDVESVLIWINQLAEGSDRQEAVNAVVTDFAAREPVAAVEWVKKFAPGQERDGAWMRVATEVTRIAPAEALKLAAALPESSGRTEIMIRAGTEWSIRAPKEAVQWVRQNVGEGARGKMLGSIAVAWSDRNPAQAADLALDSIAPGRDQDDAVASIVSNWVQKNPSAAADWVLQFPGGRLRDTALEIIISNWAQSSAKSAPVWFHSLEKGAAREYAFQALRTARK